VPAEFWLKTITVPRLQLIFHLQHPKQGTGCVPEPMNEATSRTLVIFAMAQLTSEVQAGCGYGLVFGSHDRILAVVLHPQLYTLPVPVLV
jgi:hypothetical protein